MQNPDSFYLEAILRGNSEGIKKIYREYLPRITKFVLSNHGDEEDAKDIFQEAIIIIFKKIKKEKLDLKSSFFTYLYAVCKNLWLKKLRESKKSGVTFPDEMEYKLTESWEETIITENRFRLYRAKFRDLSENCQKLLRLFFNRTPMKDIVKILEMNSISYAKKRKFQCKEKLVNLIRQDSEYKNLL